MLVSSIVWSNVAMGQRLSTTPRGSPAIGTFVERNGSSGGVGRSGWARQIESRSPPGQRGLRCARRHVVGYRRDDRTGNLSRRELAS